jgi:hypothetical protein
MRFAMGMLRMRYRLAVMLPIVAGVWLSGQMVPDAPIEHFSLPMFGEDGYKDWELRGFRGHYLGEEAAMIEGMELISYQGGAALIEDNRIRSPRADIDFAQSTASGKTSLFVTGPGYEIQGEDWTWFGKERKIVVRRKVRVSLSGGVTILD